MFGNPNSLPPPNFRVCGTRFASDKVLTAEILRRKGFSDML